MKKIFFLTLILGCLAGSSVAQTKTNDTNEKSGFVIIKPDTLKWVSSPAIKGLQTAILVGNPNEKGLYVIRAKFAPGVITPPHIHSQDRYVIVISGTWYAGIGSKFRRALRTTAGPTRC